MDHTDESLVNEIESSPFHRGLAQHSELHRGAPTSIDSVLRGPAPKTDAYDAMRRISSEQHGVVTREVKTELEHMGDLDGFKLHDFGFRGGAVLRNERPDPHQFAVKDSRADPDGPAMTSQEIADATNRVNGHKM